MNEPNINKNIAPSDLHEIEEQNEKNKMDELYGTFGYSHIFKQKVLLLLGDSERLRTMLDNGNEFVGRLLYDASQHGVSSKEIVAACESMDLKEIYKKAKKQQAIEELYNEWYEMYSQQYNQGKQR